MKNKVLEVAEFAFENGEILNAYMILKSAPILVREEVLQSDLFKRVKERIETISDFQANIRHGAGFIDPPDVSKVTVYQKLLEKLQTERRMIDVGCYSGWVGRNLALKGIQVHGTDLDPETIYMAQKMATGGLATYEVLEGTKIGEKYPNRFDGAIMFDVVEHVFDPHILIKSVEASVKDGGRVYVNLPAYEPERDEFHGKTPDNIKEHLRAFNDKEAEELFPNSEIEKIVNEDGRYSYFITYEIRRINNSI